MHIYIDADGCPVVEATVKIASQFNILCTIVCDTAHFFNINGAETITVSKGNDSADFKIANLISKGDIVITQDYGLAAMCLSRGAVVLNQNGLVYSDENIESLLNSRHISKKVRMSGGRIKGPPKRTETQNDAFKKSLIMTIKNALTEN